MTAQIRDQWGEWNLRRSNLTLYTRRPGGDYEIDLERITTTAHVRLWLDHIASKAWSGSHVSDLRDAFDQIFRMVLLVESEPEDFDEDDE